MSAVVATSEVLMMALAKMLMSVNAGAMRGRSGVGGVCFCVLRRIAASGWWNFAVAAVSSFFLVMRRWS